MNKKEYLYLVFFIMLTVIFIKTLFMVEVVITCADGTEIKIEKYDKEEDYEYLCIGHTPISAELSSLETIGTGTLNITGYSIYMD